MNQRADFSLKATYHDLGQLPTIPGVYTIIGKRTSAKVYVGQSTNIRKRMSDHLHNTSGQADLQAWLATVDTDLLTVAVFDQAACDLATELTGIAALRCVESNLIFRLRPHFNKRIFSKYMHESTSQLAINPAQPLALKVYRHGRGYALEVGLTEGLF